MNFFDHSFAKKYWSIVLYTSKGDLWVLCGPQEGIMVKSTRNSIVSFSDRVVMVSVYIPGWLTTAE